MKDTADHSTAKVLGGLELLSAEYYRQNFAKHTHEGYTVAVIERGAQRFYRTGGQHYPGQCRRCSHRSVRHGLRLGLPRFYLARQLLQRGESPATVAVVCEVLQFRQGLLSASLAGGSWAIS